MIGEFHLHFDCEFQRPGGFRLSAKFESGRGITTLFGPSGCGKTTILHLIAGLLRPDSGMICVNDRVLTDTTRKIELPPERRAIALVPQDDTLFPHLTVRRNLEFGWRRQLRRRIEPGRVIEALELGDLLDRPPRSLSGGQQRRVTLGRALLRNPDLLLLDEPLTGMDESLEARVLEYLKRVVVDFDVPTIIVTHSKAHLEELSTQVVLIRDGNVQAACAPTSRKTLFSLGERLTEHERYRVDEPGAMQY